MRHKRLRRNSSIFMIIILVLSMIPVSNNNVQAAESASDLIISEYIEGSSTNKAIELYNGTGADVDLGDYSVELYSNGNTEVQGSVDLSGTLAAGETYVIYNGGSVEAIKEQGDHQNNAVANFNGDDAIVLKNRDEIIDSIGQIADRVENLKDVTLVRNSNVMSGDTNPNDAFDPSLEWTSYPRNTFEYLGVHTMVGSESETPEEQDEAISIVDARAQKTGEVMVQGTVTAKLKNTIHIQDETAAIAVRPTSLNVQLGDEITITGALDEYNGLLQLQNAVLVGEANQIGVPDPAVLTGNQLNEENESKLATVHHVTLESVQEGNGWANYTATDGTEFLVRDETGTLELSVGTTYDSITGIVQQFGDDYQIIPRSTADVIADESAVQAVTATPTAGTIASGSEVALSTTTDEATIYYTTNGDEPTTDSEVYQEPIVVDQAMTIKAIAVKEGMETSTVTELAYTVFDQEAGMQIHDIQGESHESPLNDTFVTDIQGVVTSTYKLGSGNYFHFQTPDELADENPNTSEGMVVYTGNEAANVKAGDLVNVTGTVDEYHIDGYYDTKSNTDLAVTQINARDNQNGAVSVIEHSVELPTPIQIDESNLPSEVIDNDGFAEFDPEEDAIDFWESLEGMLVEVGTVKAVSPQEHGDLITVLEGKETNTLHGGVKLTEETANPDRIQFKLNDNNAARDFEVATGDTFEGPITGVVNYGFQNYKIYADLEDMKAKHVEGNATPETTTIVKNEDELTIASYNLENFSNNKSSSSDDKAQKLARAFANDMQSPDIIGVTEVQDNNGQDAGDSAANESYERLIQAIVDAGGVEYEYTNIDPVNNADGGAPNANIRVGFLYNPDRVTLTEGMPAGDATTAVGYEDGKLTHNPGRIDPTNRAFDDSRKPLAAQFDFQGENVVVLVNHWNSKSGDTPLFGSTQPPVYGSDEQRKEIATVVNGFTEDMKADNPNANIVSVGDFNDFQFTDALKIHEGDHMTNMINYVEDNDRYTYLYQGNSQVLDHILVSNNLVEETEIDILHINADFTDMAGRASDHDPVMVQVDLHGTGEESSLDEALAVAQDAVGHFDRASFYWSADDDRQTKLDEARAAVEAVLAIDAEYDTSLLDNILDNAQAVIDESVRLEALAEEVNVLMRDLDYNDPFGEYILNDEDLAKAMAEYEEAIELYHAAVAEGALLYMFDNDAKNELDYQKRKIDQYPIHAEQIATGVDAVNVANYTDLEAAEDTAEAKTAAVQAIVDGAIEATDLRPGAIEAEVSYNKETSKYDIEVFNDWGLSQTVSVTATFEGDQEEIIPEKVYNYENLKKGKLVINDKSVSVTLNGESQIKNGVDFRGNYAEFRGDGFENTTVIINPKSGEAIIDFTGINVEKVIINDKFKGNAKEIRGAENIETIEFGKGVDQEDISLTNSDGKPLDSLSGSLPEAIKSIPNQTVEAGETLTLSLNDYFQDVIGETLSYESTFGEINSETAELTLTLEKGRHIVAITASNEAGEVKESFSVTVTEVARVEDDEADVAARVDDYYADAYGKEGSELKAALHEIIDDHHQLSYSEVWDALKITDEDPNNTDNVKLLYSGESRAKNKNGGMVGDWNREHTWAKSHGDFGTSKGPGTDIHHLRPTDVQVNSSRGNLDFDNGGSANVKNCDECKRDGDSFEAPDEVKGDVARMLFYMAVRYEQGDKVDLELNERVNNGKTPYHGKLSVLLEWHGQDPVSEWEQNRNDKIEEIQGNRNPFIDNPEWAEDIWGAGA